MLDFLLPLLGAANHKVDNGDYHLGSIDGNKPLLDEHCY